MKQILLSALLTISLLACKSIDLPTTEESQKKIDFCKPQIESIDANINSFKKNLPKGNDFVVRINMNAMNKVLNTLANNRTDDVNFYFLQTKPFMKEDKKVLGLSYTNFLNIDTGFVSLNLKKFRFDKFERNKIYATIEIEGTGNISISGKYTGIPASTSPDVNLYMIESIVFDVLPEKPGFIQLIPEKKTLILKTKFFVKLLEWKLPWYQETPVELTEMMQPIKMPISVQSDFKLPLPAKKFGNEKLEDATYLLDFKQVNVNTDKNQIEYKCNIELIRK